MKASVIRPLVRSSSTATYETGSEQQLESERDVYSHPPSSTYFWKRITTDALEDHEGTASTGGRKSINVRFADDIDGLAGEEEQLSKLVERLDKAFTANGMDISAEKTKPMANNSSASTKRSK